MIYSFKSFLSHIWIFKALRACANIKPNLENCITEEVVQLTIVNYLNKMLKVLNKNIDVNPFKILNIEIGSEIQYNYNYY